MKFSLVVACYNQLSYTQKFFDSVKRNPSQPYEIVVVDNGSQDGTNEWLKNQSINKVISWPDNRGTQKAWNQAIKEVSPDSDYICVCNNDVFVGTNWIDGLLDVLSNPPEDLACLSPSTNPATYDMMLPHTELGLNQFRQECLGMQNQPHKLWADSLIGSCFVLPKKTIETVGLLDERFFCYYGDLDYNLQIAAKGLKAYTTSKSTTYHFGGISANPTSNALKEKDRVAFLNKWRQTKLFLDQYFNTV